MKRIIVLIGSGSKGIASLEYPLNIGYTVPVAGAKSIKTRCFDEKNCCRLI